MTGSPHDFAWAAGFVDGEGYLTVTKKNASYGIRKSGPNIGRPRRDGTTYWLQLCVTNRNPAPMERLVQLFGGKVVYRVRWAKNPYYFWRLGHDNALMAVEAMLPFLVGKRELAGVCISFQRWWSATKGENGRSMTDERRQRAEWYYLECRRLISQFHESPTGLESSPVTAIGERGIAGAGTV